MQNILKNKEVCFNDIRILNFVSELNIRDKALDS
jgi:hypothetical protein